MAEGANEAAIAFDQIRHYTEILNGYKSALATIHNGFTKFHREQEAREQLAGVLSKDNDRSLKAVSNTFDALLRSELALFGHSWDALLRSAYLSRGISLKLIDMPWREAKNEETKRVKKDAHENSDKVDKLIEEFLKDKVTKDLGEETKYPPGFSYKQFRNSLAHSNYKIYLSNETIFIDLWSFWNVEEKLTITYRQLVSILQSYINGIMDIVESNFLK